jgi:hypothetical protein
MNQEAIEIRYQILHGFRPSINDLYRLQNKDNIFPHSIYV